LKDIERKFWKRKRKRREERNLIIKGVLIKEGRRKDTVEELLKYRILIDRN